jgi:hypothetical protein
MDGLETMINQIQNHDQVGSGRWQCSGQFTHTVYAMGSEAEIVFKSFIFASEDEKVDFDIVMTIYNKSFFPKRNVIHKHACFYQ